MDAQATAKATTTAQPKAAIAMSELCSATMLSHFNHLNHLDAMNPSAPANKQTECQKANRLRGGGAAKVSISPFLLIRLCSSHLFI